MTIKIALTPRFCDPEFRKEGVNQTYVAALKKAGAITYMVPIQEHLDEIVQDFDGLLVTGGEDIQPSLYGEESHINTTIYPEFDAFDYAIIEAFYKANKPIMGICRGMQVINVYFGGSLYQDIDTDYQNLERLHYKNELEHQLSHPVKITKDTELYKILTKEECLVNSYHHQAVKKVAEGFTVSALSPEGIVEAMEKEGIYCTQWHPEKVHTIDEQLNIIKYFVQKCKEYKDKA